MTPVKSVLIDPVTGLGYYLNPPETLIPVPLGGSGSGVAVTEVDGSPAGPATTIVFPNGTISFVGAVATYTPAAGLTNPMTSVGDIIQGTTAGAPARLASVATGNALISGGVTTANSWGKIGLTTHISGVLGVANGGTGLGTLTANNVILGAGTSTPTFVAPSTSGNVLTSNGTTWTSAPAAGGGLPDFDDVLYTSAPNNSVNYAQLVAKGTSADIAVGFQWKGGNGYFSVDVPDGTTTGGVLRGALSWDGQSGAGAARTAANHVAQGVRSGLYSTTDSRVTNAQSVAIAADRASVFADNSLCTGERPTSNGEASFVMGNFGNDWAFPGMLVLGSFGNNSSGESQTMFFQLRGDITFSTSPRILKTGGLVPAFPSSGRVAQFISFVYMTVTGGDHLAAKFEGMLTSDSWPAINFVGGSAPAPTYIARTAGAITNWTVDLTLDTSVGGLNHRCADALGGSIISCRSLTIWMTNQP